MKKIIKAPFILNLYKHHMLFLCQRVTETKNDHGLQQLNQDLKKIGHGLMDIYTGNLSPREIKEWGIACLKERGVLEENKYRDWLTANQGYRILGCMDGSRWTFRQGNEKNKYIHIHPARHSPHTTRVKASSLKTAVMALACANVHGTAMNVESINETRVRFLSLSPVKHLKKNQGIHKIVDLFIKKCQRIKPVRAR
jgi:hypothetical protein